MSMSDDFAPHELEANITEELILAESSRPDEPSVESDQGWRPNPAGVKAYEARLATLRGAFEAVEGLEAGAPVRADVVTESITSTQIEYDDV